MPNLIRISVLAALSMAVSSSAFAQDADAPHEERRASVAALLGYGINFKSDDLNPFGFGFGAAGGYTFDSGIYVGGQFLFFVGESESTGEGALAVDESANIVSLGLEGGYNLRFDPVIVRPLLSMGVAWTNQTLGEAGTDISAVYFAPGVTVIYPIKQFFVGGDTRLWLITGDTRTGLSFLATGGITF
jgi:hypothetical protein